MAFERFQQGVKMPITLYYAQKVAVFHQAVPNAGDSQFWYLRQQIVRGISNPYVRLKTIEANVKFEVDLFCVMVSAVENAM